MPLQVGPTIRKLPPVSDQDPDLWNVSNDGILCLEVPDNTFLVGYAEDIAGAVSYTHLDVYKRQRYYRPPE